MPAPKRMTNLGPAKRGGQKMYLGGSKRFNERTGTYRGGGKAPPKGGAPKMPTFRPGRAGPGRMVPGGAMRQLAAGMTKQASMRGAIGKGGGPGAANRQTLRSAAKPVKRRAR